MRLLTLPALVVLFSGCVMPGVLMTAPGDCMDPQQVVVERPPIFVQTYESIHELVFDQTSDRYVVASTFDHDGAPYGVVVRDHGVYAAWGDRVVRFDRNLNVLDEREGRYGGLTVRDGAVWVGGQGTLEVMDRRLQTIATQRFEAGTEKVSHDVIVCPPYALLLDNVVVPVYLYQVDISDRMDPQTLVEERFDCLCHLSAQWTDADQEKWYVVQSSGGMGFASQSVHTYAIGGAKESETTTFRYQSEESFGDDAEPPEGIRILAVSPTDPPLAVAWTEGSHWVGSLEVTSDGVELVDRIRLDEDGDPRTGAGDIDVRGDVAVAWVDDRLFVVHLGVEGGAVHTQETPLGSAVRHLAIG